MNTSPKLVATRPEGRSSLAAEIERQLDIVSRALVAGLEDRDLPGFYRVLRASSIPFLALEHDLPPDELFSHCYRVLHRLGGISPAVALALENHLYMVCGIATLPVGSAAPLDRRRRLLLDRLREGRLFLANTNSHVHEKQAHRLGTRARRTANGYRITGRSAYMSLATEADLIIFSTQLEGEGLVVFVAPLRGNPGIEIGPYTFPDAMRDSETHVVSFHDLELTEDHLFAAAVRDDLFRVFTYQHSWHQALLSGLFVGAAAGALEEVRRFARELELPDGTLLAEQESLVRAVGALAIRHRAACAGGLQMAERLERISRSGLDDVEQLESLLELAGALKYHSTSTAEEIVTASRRIIGGRGFSGGKAIERLSQEVMFGPLVADVGPTIEKNLGRRVLREERFLGL